LSLPKNKGAGVSLVVNAAAYTAVDHAESEPREIEMIKSLITPVYQRYWPDSWCCAPDGFLGYAYILGY